MARARISEREGFGHGEVGRTGCCRGEEENHHPGDGLLGGVDHLLLEQVAAETEQDPGNQVGAADHDAPTDHVEQPAEQQRPAEVAEGEGQQVPADVGGRHVVEVGEHQGIGEEDRVVEKRLGGQQGQTDERPAVVSERMNASLSFWRKAGTLSADMAWGYLFWCSPKIPPVKLELSGIRRTIIDELST